MRRNLGTVLAAVLMGCGIVGCGEDPTTLPKDAMKPSIPVVPAGTTTDMKALMKQSGVTSLPKAPAQLGPPGAPR